MILELLPRFQQEASSFERLYAHSPFGALAPLTAATRFDLGVLPQTINHQGLLPAITVAFNLADCSTPSSASSCCSASSGKTRS